MLRTGSICASFLYKYLTTNDNDNEKETDDNVKDYVEDKEGDIDFKKKKFKIKCLSEVFADCGGILSKISQIICMDYGDYENTVFSDCKPYNPEKTIDYLRKELNSEKYKDKILDFDYNVYKSGSIGQVHKAKTIDGEDIVLKVQYYGLYEQFKIDIGILNTLTTVLFYKEELKDVLVGVEKKVYQELDYIREIENHNLVYDLWKDDENIKISRIINELCTDKIISLKYIDGESLTSFVNNSTIEERNYIATKIGEFIFTTIFKYKLFYGDIHYGNFLVKDKKTLYVMDFGFISEIDDELLHNLKMLYKSLYEEDDELFYAIVEDLGILNERIKEDEDIKFMLRRFKEFLEPLLCKGNFDYNNEWYKKIGTADKRSEYWGLTDEIVVFAKIPFGFLSMLVNMNVNINMSEIILKLIEEN
jgi:predicted unusual protein kinase regulating ubiquinone biosynthesis (AarF/ABC1/UbiB family)